LRPVLREENRLQSEPRLLSEALEALWEQTDIRGTVVELDPQVATDHRADASVDLVPFGAISNGTSAIAWPPDLKTIMNVAGYEDVLAAAELVE
jgi:predicted nucleotidyltransferase